jgi:hypothetical protein
MEGEIIIDDENSMEGETMIDDENYVEGENDKEESPRDEIPHKVDNPNDSDSNSDNVFSNLNPLWNIFGI